MKRTTVHPQVDLDHWAKMFPVESLLKSRAPQLPDSKESDGPLDLSKLNGNIITSPAHLWQVELVRKYYEKSKDLGPAVPVDIFLWSIAPPAKPYLTKLGGTPHRESSKPWPTDQGKPHTFVAQFCFADSRDIISRKLPGDIMLIFFKEADSLYEMEPDSIHIEWSSIELASPLTAEQCPAPSFTVPQLSGHIYRTYEYPEGDEVFEQEGHNEFWHFATTQSTKIGRETFFIQSDPRDPGNELLCALNSLHPDVYTRGKWPFIGLEDLPDDWNKPEEHYGWGKYQMMFADVGCMYFMIDKKGNITWDWDSY
ncbi:MAG: DUF1963 domain-containing protein [Candidatus Sumerlaeia bacterium]|nr:DUF1963 domain-containing protein [Candidatus Sumerlaeia bacterium]